MESIRAFVKLVYKLSISIKDGLTGDCLVKPD